MRELIIAPSILSLDYSQFDSQCDALCKSEAKWLHFDVMDGHFVPNLTFGPDILKGYRKRCAELVMDAHLMVEEPWKFAEVFAKAGADVITFHYEVFDDAKKCIDFCKQLHELGVKAGISIKPKTPVDVLETILPHVDLVLVMSVEPGFGGQAFMADMLDKVKTLRKWIDEQQLDCLIEIDGGIKADTGKLAVDAGVDVLVAGSYVFKGDIAANVQSLKCLK